uniref:Uncharacterized protein n=1 Tax=Schistosoma japonicum TaxID=6182 RepID=C7TZ65_SCHJA|nr:hypothetical protein [Schistosoma japonicum]
MQNKIMSTWNLGVEEKSIVLCQKDKDRENTKQKHWYSETINVYTGIQGHDKLLTLTERTGRISINT